MSGDAPGYDIDRYMNLVTPRPGDFTFSILKAHLVIEEVLREYLAHVLPKPEALRGARLAFAQLLAVSQATSPNIDVDDWMWVAISKLNQLRNLLAHNLTPAALAEKSRDYVNFVVASLKAPLPTPAISGGSGGDSIPNSTDARETTFTAVDMVTVGLYAQAATRLLKLEPLKFEIAKLQQEKAGLLNRPGF